MTSRTKLDLENDLATMTACWENERHRNNELYARLEAEEATSTNYKATHAALAADVIKIDAARATAVGELKAMTQRRDNLMGVIARLEEHARAVLPAAWVAKDAVDVTRKYLSNAAVRIEELKTELSDTRDEVEWADKVIDGLIEMLGKKRRKKNAARLAEIEAERKTMLPMRHGVASPEALANHLWSQLWPLKGQP